ncbi:MAG: Sec-independent protein translocase protein TatB [bacterium]|nr:Sec-independent protein translocase protein TatB [bacterium]MDE0242320.1 Sec-independent protein translocase protein TatB [bacterium]
MFDLGWFEIAVVGAVLLVVVGPKDLPKVLRTVGVWTGKARRMARDFQKALDQYAKEAEIDDVKKAVETPLKAKKAVAAAVDPTGALKKELEETGREMQENMKVRDEPEATAQAAPTEPVRASSGDT